MYFDFGDSEERTLPEGISRNEDGNLVNADGQLVDENGNIIEELDKETEEEKAARLAKEAEEAEKARLAAEEEARKKEGKGDENEIVLEEGQSIEVTENGQTVTYTVDKDLNLVDKDGKIFKTAEEAKEYLKGYITNENPDEISLDSIRKSVGYDVVDENGKPVEFENTPEGIAKYVTSVIDNQKEELMTSAINGVFAKYPILGDVLNYYVANGNSLEGFNTVPDRSNITIDDNNEAQQESIIRTAWKEQNRAGDIDAYINYLKTTGILLNTAKTELDALKAADKAAKDKMAEEAKQVELANQQKMQEYWNSVHDTIKNRKIGSYTIPETITINKDGVKVAVTPEDFFNYVFQVDKDGHSRYENDLLALKPEARRDDEILRAYLTFTGGSYADLVKMAINEEKVKTIKLQAKNNANRQVKVTPKTTETKPVDFGF